MRRSTLAVVLAAGWCGLVPAADPPKVVAEGNWSKAVADKRSRAVRGRLVLAERPRTDDRREVAVYVELQEASDSIGDTLRVFCDLGKNDFRPEYKGGLWCELTDKDGKAVKASGFAFSGAVPKSEWVSLPTDGTIRLRATPFGIHREKATAVCPDLGTLWEIADGDAAEYKLSGTFTVDPPADVKPPADGHVWRGTLDLPALTLTGRKK